MSRKSLPPPTKTHPRFPTDNSETRFIDLEFISSDDSGEDNGPSTQTLIIILSSGFVIGIKIPIEGIYQSATETPQNLPTMFNSMQFLKCSLPLTGDTKVLKARVFVKHSSDIGIVYLQSDHTLTVAYIGSPSSFSTPSVDDCEIQEVNVQDFQLLACMSSSSQKAFLTLLSKDSSLVLIDLLSSDEEEEEEEEEEACSNPVLCTKRLTVAGHALAVVDFQCSASMTTIALMVTEDPSPLVGVPPIPVGTGGGVGGGTTAATSTSISTTAKMQTLCLLIHSSPPHGEDSASTTPAYSVRVIDIGMRSLFGAFQDSTPLQGREKAVFPSSTQYVTYSDLDSLVDSTEHAHAGRGRAAICVVLTEELEALVACPAPLLQDLLRDLYTGLRKPPFLPLDRLVSKDKTAKAGVSGTVPHIPSAAWLVGASTADILALLSPPLPPSLSAEATYQGLLESYLQCLDQVPTSTSLPCRGSRILSVVLTLLDFPLLNTRFGPPPTNFVSTMLTKAERSIGIWIGAGTGSFKYNDLANAAKQRCLAEVLKLQHLQESAESLLELHSPRNSDETVSSITHDDEGSITCDEEQVQKHEELARLHLLSLLPSQVQDTVLRLLQEGQLKQATFIAAGYMRGPLPLQFFKALYSIPTDTDTDTTVPVPVPVQDILHWIRDVILPRIRSTAPISTVSSDAAALSSTAQLLRVAEYLCTTAKRSELRSGRPFDALQYVSLAIQVTSTISFNANNETTRGFLSQIRTLSSNFHLQASIWSIWHEPISLHEVERLGADGLVFDRLDNLPEDQLVRDIEESISPILTRLGLDLDSVLSRWVADVLKSCVILGAGIGNEESEEEQSKARTCSLTRLVVVLSRIRDKNVAAKLVLDLFAKPAVDGSVSQLQQSAVATSTSKMLCDLASTVCEFVDTNTRFRLTEARQKLKLKSLAISYNIDGFDPRKPTQVRRAIGIIACRSDR